MNDQPKINKAQSILLTVLFVLALFGGGLTLLLLPKETYSEPERRPLASAPSVSFKSVSDGRVFTETDAWVTDHFAFRETFRSMKSFWQWNVLRENENNGLVIENGSVMKLEKNVNRDSLAYAGARFRDLFDRYLSSSGCRIYSALIPDKSSFLADQGNGYPVMDFTEMETLFRESIPDSAYVSLKEHLSLADYYLTDTHWKQECLLPAANALLKAMGGTGELRIEDFELRERGGFRGVYLGQSALPMEPDVITYLTGGPIAGCTVTDLTSMEKIPMYDPEGCDERDLYTLFLGGSKGILRIDNPALSGEEGKELIVFRDSFGASLVPLLCAEYRTVYLIDTRYVHPSLLKRYVRFDSQDVLFLFSATLMNSSQALKE